MGIRKNFKHTLAACYIGYINQAIVNNFIPLLFLTFNRTFDIPMGMIGLLVTVNFATQLIVDLIAARFIDRLGYRIPIVSAHILSAIGLIGLAFLPNILPDPYIALMICIIIYAIGGGIIEVLISPIVEACPSEKKSATMSFLHSFFAWGSVLVILLSTVFFSVFGIDCWPYVALGWSLIPIFNSIYFSLVPINSLTEKGERRTRLRDLFSSKLFWVLALVMVGSGASELAISQWSSAFAEAGLGVNKTVGDIAGPCAFAALMGISRVFYAKISEKTDLRKYILLCSALCIVGYLLAALSPWPVPALIGCGICGFAVGVMWPGTFSLASEKIPRGGTAMFALLALFGDLGCGIGPAITGAVSDATSGSLSLGILACIIFPALVLFGMIILKKQKNG